ncbi:unnamed protein product [Owenia fusiformis]|uniref:Uncharacterized protein n=1 Tax=Owenia fusiformis TaxID=6347 RepID=A0A8J1TAU2_OWEFU|nr:unnamed protein product [Owenia fusiformis]
MGLWATMKTWVVFHILFGYVFVVSGLIVNFFQLCSMVVWPFDRQLYRKINCNLVYLHWCQLTAGAAWWSGSTNTVYMDPETFKLVGKEHALVLGNHKYDIDWLMAWLPVEHLRMLGGSKIYGKEMLKYVPLIGWAWYFSESIFLKRQWEKDREIIKHDIGKLCDFPKDYWMTILLFPEGTRFTDKKHAASMEVARKKGMPELKHHLLPRTKGFVLSMYGLKGKIPAIYDCTIGFRKDGAPPSFFSILNGKACRSEMYVRRYATKDIPTDTEEECAEWLHQLFREKDELYDGFAKNGHFTGPKHDLPRTPYDLIIWLTWCVILSVPLLHYLMSVFLIGTYLQQVTVIIVCILGAVGIRALIGITETEKGSDYGADKKIS